MNQVAIAKAGGKQHARHPPRIDFLALQFINGPGRGEDTLGLVPGQRIETTERRCLLLQLDQIALAGQRQFRQRFPRRTFERIDAGQRMKVIRTGFLGVRHLTGQFVHQVVLALGGVTRFQRIEVAHDSQRFLRR